MTSKKVGGPTLDHNDGKDPKGGSPWNFLLIVIVSVVAFSVLAGFAGDLMYIWGGFVPGLFPLVLPCIVVLALVLSTGYVVRQQHVSVIERLGKFHGFAGPGFHVKFPFIDITHDVSLMTEDEHMTFDAKTSDNVTIELDVSIQYHVDYADIDKGADSGVYRSFYTLQDPVGQMQDYLADALRSQIPARTLDEVFTVLANTGIGIRHEDQPRIFERFFRVDKSRSKATGGTGLGLSIVKHAVQLLGGSIDLESEPNGGTRITVHFPWQAG